MHLRIHTGKLTFRTVTFEVLTDDGVKDLVTWCSLLREMQDVNELFQNFP